MRKNHLWFGKQTDAVDYTLSEQFLPHDNGNWFVVDEAIKIRNFHE
jgi:hypothetical protein